MCFGGRPEEDAGALARARLPAKRLCYISVLATSSISIWEASLAWLRFLGL